MVGKLYICATPIGNLEDITLRVLRILKEVDLIAAEDTRKTRSLLTHFGIKAPLVSYHEGNEITRSRELIKKLKEGRTVALVSEAGMPGISDPGYRLITSSLQEEIHVEVLPGPSALINALVVSGLPTHRFSFEGFLPRKKGERERALSRLTKNPRTMIFYEAPHRVEKTLVSIIDLLGDRRMALVRELTKKFEEIKRGKATEILEWVGEKPPRGEIVLVVEGTKRERPVVKEADLKRAVNKEIQKGIAKKKAIQIVAAKLGVSKRLVYETVKELKDKGLRQ